MRGGRGEEGKKWVEWFLFGCCLLFFIALDGIVLPKKATRVIKMSILQRSEVERNRER